MPDATRHQHIFALPAQDNTDLSVVCLQNKFGLTTEQNHNFIDHYLVVDYDLSDVMFLCTSNSMNIPPALLDRMEVIRLPGYTEDEKINIAVKYLSPKQIAANGLKKGELEFDAEAIRDIIRYYTREAGVRGLERQIAKVCRKAVKEHALEKRFSVKVTADSLEHFLGVKKFRYGLAEQCLPWRIRCGMRFERFAFQPRIDTTLTLNGQIGGSHDTRPHGGRTFTGRRLGKVCRRQCRYFNTKINTIKQRS